MPKKKLFLCLGKVFLKKENVIYNYYMTDYILIKLFFARVLKKTNTD